MAYQYIDTIRYAQCVCFHNQEISGGQVADMGRGEGASGVGSIAKMERSRRMQKLG